MYLIAFATIVHVLFSYIVPLASAFISPWFIGLGRLPLPFGLLKPIAWVVGLYLISRSGANPTGVRGHTWQIDAANVNCFVAYLFLLVHLLGNPLGYYVGLLLPQPPRGDLLLRGYLLLLPACLLASLMLLVVWKVDGLSPSSRIPEREAQYRSGHVMLLFATVLYAVAAFAIPLAAKFISPWLGFGLWFTGHIYFLALMGWLIGSYLVLRARTRLLAPSANAGAA